MTKSGCLRPMSLLPAAQSIKMKRSVHLSPRALSDEEGLQIMRNLGRNMAWMLRCIEAGKAAGIAAPVAENDKRTNFIR